MVILVKQNVFVTLFINLYKTSTVR